MGFQLEEGGNKSQEGNATGFSPCHSAYLLLHEGPAVQEHTDNLAHCFSQTLAAFTHT